MFDKYYTFAVVRNPWSRVVSMYHYHNYTISFKKFVNCKLSGNLWRDKYWFVRPQSEFVCDGRGNVLVDDVFKLEEIQQKIQSLKEHSGLCSKVKKINTANLTWTNPSITDRCNLLLSDLKNFKLDIFSRLFSRQEYYAAWRDYYDDETRFNVHELYQSDVERFGYTFEEK